MSAIFSCWCYAAQRQVQVKGRIVGKRQVDLLEILDCEHKDCAKRYAKDCLIGKLLEGRWPKETKREKEIERNFNIASKCYGSKRAKFAIYRLYRYCNVTPKQIAWRLSELNHWTTVFTTQQIRTIIAQVFADHCLKNKCVFRPFLKR